MEGNDNREDTLPIKHNQYIVEIYFSQTGEYIGDAIFGDKRTLAIEEKGNNGYNIIFRENTDKKDAVKIEGKTYEKYITKKEDCDISRPPKSGVMQYVIKKIWVNKYWYQDQTDGKLKIVDKADEEEEDNATQDGNAKPPDTQNV